MEEHIDESFFTDDIIAQKISQIELKKTGFENTFNERQIGSITKCIEPVSDQNPLETLVDLFDQQPDLEAVPIEENNSVIGIIDRKQVKELTSSAFKRFLAKNCGEYVKRVPLTLSSRDFMEKVLSKVNGVSKEYGVKHFIVLMNNRSFYGIAGLEDIRSKIEELRSHDLEKAEIIQQYMLPKNEDVKDFPFKTSIWNKMANPVGGDFYAAQKLTDAAYITGVFDVSGKNVSAALLTITIGSFFATLKRFSHAETSALKITSMLDSYLQSIVPVGNFITGALCYVDTALNEITILNCGHTDVYALMKSDGNKIKLATLTPTLPPLGMGAVSDALKTSGKGGYKLAVSSGIQINMYSDGLTDMQNDEGTRYDETNTKKFFLDYYSKESDVLKSFASDTVTKWIEHSMLPDDITIMNIRF
jgi:sigma-B regulation protein RsbU (phosphoserine phosphatase)